MMYLNGLVSMRPSDKKFALINVVERGAAYLHEKLAMVTKYIDAANNHDAAARAALYTEDAVFVTHSGPLHP